MTFLILPDLNAAALNPIASTDVHKWAKVRRTCTVSDPQNATELEYVSQAPTEHDFVARRSRLAALHLAGAEMPDDNSSPGALAAWNLWCRLVV